MVWTAREIQPGEEITISCEFDSVPKALLTALLTMADSDVELTYEERQKTLLNLWGFKCTCRLCTSPKPVIAASDKRRKLMGELRELTLKKAMDKQYQVAIQAAEELLTTAEDEGLTAHIGEFWEIPAKLYFNVGDMGRAEKYIRLAIEEIDRYGTQGELGLQKLSMYNGLLKEILKRRARQ